MGQRVVSARRIVPSQWLGTADFKLLPGERLQVERPHVVEQRVGPGVPRSSAPTEDDHAIVDWIVYGRTAGSGTWVTVRCYLFEHRTHRVVNPSPSHQVRVGIAVDRCAIVAAKKDQAPTDRIHDSEGLASAVGTYGGPRLGAQRSARVGLGGVGLSGVGLGGIGHSGIGLCGVGLCVTRTTTTAHGHHGQYNDQNHSLHHISYCAAPSAIQLIIMSIWHCSSAGPSGGMVLPAKSPPANTFCTR